MNEKLENESCYCFEVRFAQNQSRSLISQANELEIHQILCLTLKIFNKTVMKNSDHTYCEFLFEYSTC